MLLCYFKFCKNPPEILCLCTEPGIMICKDHILDHISLFDKSHNVESLFGEIPKDKKLAIISHIEAQIKKLVGFKKDFITKSEEAISCILNRLNSELKSIDENIGVLDKLIKEIQLLTKAPKINNTDIERCLTLPIADAIDFLKGYLPSICSCETLEIKSFNFWETKEDFMTSKCEVNAQRNQRNLKHLTGYNTFVKEKFIELCKKEGERPRAHEFMKIIAEKWNLLTSNEKITYAENARKLSQKAEIQVNPQTSSCKKNKYAEEEGNESDCDIIEVLGNCIS